MLQLNPRGVLHRSGGLDDGMDALASDCLDITGGADRAPLSRFAGPSCTRLFIDRSRGRRRRWCGMKGCGDRAKAPAYRRRHRSIDEEQRIPAQDSGRWHLRLPVPVAIVLSLVGGACSAAQAEVNGGLSDRVGSPVTAALVSNGLATVILCLTTASFGSIRIGLRRLRGARLPWWQYAGGALGALAVAGAALAAPVLGVALFTVVQVCGTSVGGMASDRIGLGPSGRLPVTGMRLASAALATAAVAVAQLGRPIGHIAIGMVAFVLALGLARPVQVALNGRITAASGHVGSASLVNAVVGTSALIAAAVLFRVTGNLPFHGWPVQWWVYVGGLLAIVVTGANMLSVQSIGVLRTGLCALAGQITGGVVLDALVPGAVRPTGWLIAGASLTMIASLTAGARMRAGRVR